MGIEKPSVYSPLLWPWENLSIVLTQETPSEKKPIEPCTPTVGPTEHLLAACAATRSFLFALLCVYGLYGENQYPAYGRAATWSFDWIYPIIIRNLVGTILICGFWDWLLYFSPLKSKFTPYKITTDYPSMTQMKHDIFWTMSASLTAVPIEAILCHFWATGLIPFERQLRTSPIQNFLWAALITHWRIPHFWLMHRMMHPWKIAGIPDMGKMLYKSVHSLHHKSYNPTAFSGTSMHPVESTLYYTACLVAVPFGCHPAIVLGGIVDCAIGAWLGHDGFQWPGQADYMHYLHHAHFDCNYGSQHVPLDYWFGTFIGKKEDLKKIWGKKNAKTVGREANEKVCGVHPGDETTGKKTE